MLLKNVNKILSVFSEGHKQLSSNQRVGQTVNLSLKAANDTQTCGFYELIKDRIKRV